MSGGIPAIQHKLVAMSATILSSLPPMKRQETSHWIRNKVTSSRSGHWPHLATPSLSYTRPLQNSKAATLGVKPTHLLCISVEGMGGPTTTTPPSLHHHLTRCQAHPPPLYLCRGGGRVHHHHSTFPPPPLHLHSTITPPSSLPPPSFTMDSNHQLQSKRRLRNR